MKKIAILLTMCLLFAFPLSLLAYVMTDKKDHVDYYQSDLDGDGIAETVELMRKDAGVPGGGIDNATIKVESKGKTFLLKDAEIISGYSSGIEEIVVSGEFNPFIALSTHAPGSMHSWDVKLYSFDGEQIKHELDIWSDGSYIEVKDVDHDGENEIIVNTRDYEYHPVEDRFVTTLKYNGKEWQVVSRYETRTKKYLPLE